jgi:hypothetical protein
MPTYVVQAGDTPSSVALKLSGNSANYRALCPLNASLKCSNQAPTKFWVGMTLTIPDGWGSSPAPLPTSQPSASAQTPVQQVPWGPAVVSVDPVVAAAPLQPVVDFPSPATSPVLRAGSQVVQSPSGGSSWKTYGYVGAGLLALVGVAIWVWPSKAA